MKLQHFSTRNHRNLLMTLWTTESMDPNCCMIAPTICLVLEAKPRKVAMLRLNLLLRHHHLTKLVSQVFSMQLGGFGFLFFRAEADVPAVAPTDIVSVINSSSSSAISSSSSADFVSARSSSNGSSESSEISSRQSFPFAALEPVKKQR